MTDLHQVDLASNDAEAPLEPGFAVLWWNHLPLGQLHIERRQTTAEPSVRQRIADTIAPAVADLLAARSAQSNPGSGDHWIHQLPDRSPLELLSECDAFDLRGIDGTTVSVIICTRDRPESLHRTLSALAAQSVSPLEIIVVDNGSTGNATQAVTAEFAGVRYRREPRPGLSIARNTGIATAQGTVIAFTDDDAEPHQHWVAQIARIMAADPSLAAMTGLALPADLSSPAQELFEAHTSFGGGYVRRTFGPDWYPDGTNRDRKSVV